MRRLGLLLIAVATACSSSPPPTSPTPADHADRPVVFVAGVTGSQLRDPKLDEILFGSGINLFWPRDGGYGIALPIDSGSPSEVEAVAVVEAVELAFVRVEAFGPLLRSLEDEGFVRGDLGAPQPSDSLLPFPYDWRKDAMFTAAQLAEALDRLRRARGEQRLSIDLVCQSTGAHACRYLLKYGNASLADAAAGRAAPLDWLSVRSLVLISSANGGSLRTLRELNRGRRYMRVLGRVLRPEVFFTFRSLFQDLPCGREGLVVDADGQPLEVEICRAESFERYGWSVYGEASAARVAETDRSDLFATAEVRDRYLERHLADGVRFRRLLAADVPGFDVGAIHLIQDASRDTPKRAVVVQDDGRWQTFFTHDPEIEEVPSVRAHVTAPGDGHATRESQLDLSAQEREALVGSPHYVEGGHFELVRNPETHRILIEILDASRGAGRRASLRALRLFEDGPQRSLDDRAAEPGADGE